MKCGPTPRARRPAAADRPAQPGERAGPADADHPHGRRQGRGEAAAADPRRAARGASRSCGASTRCTATRSRRRPATRPASSTASSTRCTSAFAVHARRGQLCRRRAFRDDRPGRHRMHRRRAGDQRAGARRPLPHPLRPAAQRQPGARARLRDRRGAEGSAAPARPTAMPRPRQRGLRRGSSRGRRERAVDADAARTTRGAHRQLFPEDQGDRRAVRRPRGDLRGVHAPAGDLRAALRGRVSRRHGGRARRRVRHRAAATPRATGSAPASRSSTSPARSTISSISRPCCCRSWGRPASPPTTPRRCAPTCPRSRSWRWTRGTAPAPRWPR